MVRSLHRLRQNENRTAHNRTDKKFFQTCIKKMALANEQSDYQTCRNCQHRCLAEAFYKNCTVCKCCYNENNRRRINSNVENFLQNLLGRARTSAKERKGDASIFAITLDDLMNIFATQGGKCYYSGIPLSTKMLTNWQCSLERLDQRKGYIFSNIALIAGEFQGACQWSQLKYSEFRKLSAIAHPKQLITWSREGLIKPIAPRQATAEGRLSRFCYSCQTDKALSQYSKNLSAGCKLCVSKYEKQHRSTPKGHIAYKRNIMSQRNKKKGFGAMSLHLNDLIEIIENQNGLCFYSGIPLQFGSHLDKWWTASPERKDITRGYTKENVCFICYEFNTADYTSNAKNPQHVLGNSAWSIEKMAFVKGFTA